VNPWDKSRDSCPGFFPFYCIFVAQYIVINSIY
jgi:hypothetical protein